MKFNEILEHIGCDLKDYDHNFHRVIEYGNQFLHSVRMGHEVIELVEYKADYFRIDSYIH